MWPDHSNAFTRKTRVYIYIFFFWLKKNESQFCYDRPFHFWLHSIYFFFWAELSSTEHKWLRISARTEEFHVNHDVDRHNTKSDRIKVRQCSDRLSVGSEIRSPFWLEVAKHRSRAVAFSQRNLRYSCCIDGFTMWTCTVFSFSASLRTSKIQMHRRQSNLEMHLFNMDDTFI